MIIYDDLAQRSAEWFQLRCGKLTGSRAADMLSTIKSGEAAARRDLRMQLVCERLTGQPQEDGYTNAVMQRGIELEPQAFAAYEALTGHIATTIGFIDLDPIKAGCSPDGLIESNDPNDEYGCVVSLKCPKSSTHLRYLQANAMPPEYVPQMLHELWVTSAYCYDFLSFDPRFPAKLQTFWIRVERDHQAVKDYEAKALAFLAEVDRVCEALGTSFDLKGQLERAAV